MHKTRLATRWIIGFFAAASLGAAQAGVIWSENFDAGTSGQALDAPPLGWTAHLGTLRLQSGLHAGWNGQAISGAVTSSPRSGSWAGTALAVPNTGVVTLSYDTWAPTQTYGAEVGLYRANGDNVRLASWSNSNFDNAWELSTVGAGTVVVDWLSDPSLLRDQTVHVTLTLDYLQDTFGVSLQGTGTTVHSPSFGLGGSDPFVELRLYSDVRGGTIGADFDNFSLTATSVDEPSAVALMALGVLALGLRHRRGRRMQRPAVWVPPGD